MPSRSSNGPRPAQASSRRLVSACTCGIVAGTAGRSRSSVLILAFDTATSIATSALVREGVDALLRAADVEPPDLEAIAVGVGPGSFTGVRMGLAAARGLALSLGIPVAGVSTLSALAAGAPGAVPLIDAKRRELFLELDGEIVAMPAAAFEAHGQTCVGDGAVRY